MRTLRLSLVLVLGVLGSASCSRSPHAKRKAAAPAPTAVAAASQAPPATGGTAPVLPGRAALDRIVRTLTAQRGHQHRAAIERGVRQVAASWRPADGDIDKLEAFLATHLLTDPVQRDRTFRRIEALFEQTWGHLNEIGRELRFHSDVDTGPMLPVDKLFATVDPSAHVVEDFFRSKVGFVALANFPLTRLSERLGQGTGWSRRRWAEVRLAQRFDRRIPGEVMQKLAQAGAEAAMYIAGYNIYVHHVLGPNDTRLFPKGRRLITHWNLRDELKAAYAVKNGLPRQRALTKVMERIVTQTIPAVVIDNPRVDWDPATNTVRPAPAQTIEKGAQLRGRVDPAREPDTRYAKLLGCFRAARAEDRYSPMTPTLIARRFELDREIPRKRVEAMLEKVLTSPLLKRMGKLISKRLGRPLEPFDIWYDGFRPRGRFPEAKLDAITRRRYPNVASFQRAIPEILRKLGFSAARARYLADRIVVDASRGAGHAMEAMRRQDKPRLRTRVGRKGMDYKGYNIAVHELGHNVEQVFSLYDVDHTLLQGVPNTAFTEALAFVFQNRDLELLGLSKPDPRRKRLETLNSLWMTYEIGAVGLVDLAVWDWMYQNPDATPARLRRATIRIAKDIWNRYFAPVFGKRDVLLLGVYSHMISNFFYLPDYAIGHLIAFQIEEHLEKQKGKSLGAEFERMAKYGRLTPDQWMRHATGEPVSPDALLRAAAAALAAEERAAP